MTSSRRIQLLVLGAFLYIGFGLVANPWVVGPDNMYDPVGESLLIIEGVIGLGWIAACWISRLRAAEVAVQREIVSSDSRADGMGPGQRVVMSLVLLYIALLWLTLFWKRWHEPTLQFDDFDYIALARTWPDTYQNLLTPYNEHICVPTRLLTWLICAFVDESHWSQALVRAGMALCALTWLPLMWFVHRETGSPTLALLSVSFFALTTTHQEVVMWYSASQWCWAVLVTVSTLLVLQSNEGELPLWRLATSAVLAGIGPLCYMVGGVAGPIGTAYLIARRQLRLSTMSLGRCALPLLGTLICVLLLVPFKAPGILKKASYRGKSIAQASSVSQGILYVLRSTVDQLLLRNLGVDSGPRRTRVRYAAIFFVIALALGEFVRCSDRPILLLLGCAFVIMPYALMLPFRAWVQYDTFLEWTRYQLFPQIGFALVVCSVLARWGPHWVLDKRIDLRHVLLIILIATWQRLVH
jgi:hypothetical protein